MTTHPFTYFQAILAFFFFFDLQTSDVSFKNSHELLHLIGEN